MSGLRERLPCDSRGLGAFAPGRRLVRYFGGALAAAGIMVRATAGAGGGPGSAFGEGLRLTNTAWALGVSEAMAASGAGVSAISLNPAGVLDAGVTTIHLTHSFFVEDLAEDYLAFSQRMPFGSAIGVSVHGMYDGSSERVLEDAEGNYAGEAGGYPLGFAVAGVAYALDLNPLLGPLGVFKTTGGAGVRVVWQRIEKREWLGIAVDLGFKVRPGAGFVVGGVLQNAGVVSGSSHLPLQWVTGLAWEGQHLLASSDRFLVEVDSPVAVDRELSFRAGSEYRLRFGRVEFAVRGGWKEDMEVLNAPGYTGGFGFRWFMGLTPWGMDYAYVPWGALGNLHAVSLTVGLVPRPEPPLIEREREPREAPLVFFPFKGEKARYDLTVTETSWVSAVLLDQEGNYIMSVFERRIVTPGAVEVVWDGVLPTGALAAFDYDYRLRIQIGGFTWYKTLMLKKEE